MHMKNGDARLVARCAELFQGEHGHQEGLIVEEGVERRAELIGDGGLRDGQAVCVGVPQVEAAGEVDGGARHRAARKARE